MRRALGHWVQLRSSVSGRPLTTRALAYILWERNQCDPRVPGYLGPWAPPALGRQIETAQADAKSIVRSRLAARATDHLRRCVSGHPVSALRMRAKDGDQGAHVVLGLPGLYSPAWPTTIGLEGEATLGEAQATARGGALELVQLDLQEIRAVRARLRTAAPDEAAVAEEVAKRYNRAEARAAERCVERLLAEARTWEYTHRGAAHLSERRELPPTRTT